MKKVLEARGFNITECCGENATRDSIRTAWQNIIDKSSSGDTVVIFHSGHGDWSRHGGKWTEDKGDRNRPRQYQFLVPIDFDESSNGDFRGILDVEIAHMLWDTTNKTPSVTVILNCCHPGRVARHVTHGDNATPKELLLIQHHDIDKWIEILKQRGYLRGEAAIEVYSFTGMA